MYLIGFCVVYGLLKLRISKGEFSVFPHRDKPEAKIFKSQFPISNKISNFKFLPAGISSKQKISNLVTDFLLLSFIAALVGGRLGYVLFYDFSYFWSHPLAIVSPYDKISGQYVGIFGMSYHGALLGVVVAIWYFSRKYKLNFWQWTDFIVPAIPAGYFFGRIGNFLNGELYGRVTDYPLGMYFFQDRFNLRHPSQLYEAFGEGILLFVLLWPLRNKKYNPGTLSILYVLGYGAMRFGIEFFRQPDPQIGLLGDWFTLGQIFSLVMILLAAAFFVRRTKSFFVHR